MNKNILAATFYQFGDRSLDETQLGSDTYRLAYLKGSEAVIGFCPQTNRLGTWATRRSIRKDNMLIEVWMDNGFIQHRSTGVLNSNEVEASQKVIDHLRSDLHPPGR